MTTNHRSGQAQALVDAYLSDLDRALASAEPREKADTLAAVQEHIDEALADRGGDPQAVSQVLSALGPVESIASTATPIDGAVGVSGARAVLVCSIVSLALVFFAPIIAPIVAVAALAAALILLRRRPQQRGTLHGSILVSSATIVVVAIMGIFLLSTGSDTITPEPVQTELSTDG